MPNNDAKPPLGQLWECANCGLMAEWHPESEGGYYTHCDCNFRFGQRGTQLRFVGYEQGYGPDVLQTPTQETS